MRTVLGATLLLLIAGLSVPASAVTHTRVHKVRRTSLRATHQFALHFSPVFRGSHEMLVQQNVELDKLQLPRIYDDNELLSYELSQDLVPVSESDALKIAANLPDNRRYCRSWTRDFLEDFSQAFYTQFHQPLQVNSLVRTVEQQASLAVTTVLPLLSLATRHRLTDPRQRRPIASRLHHGGATPEEIWHIKKV